MYFSLSNNIKHLCRINHRLLLTELCELNIYSLKCFLKCCRTFCAKGIIFHTKKYDMLHLKNKSCYKMYVCVFIPTVLMVFNKGVRNHQIVVTKDNQSHVS